MSCFGVIVVGAAAAAASAAACGWYPFIFQRLSALPTSKRPPPPSSQYISKNFLFVVGLHILGVCIFYISCYEYIYCSPFCFSRTFTLSSRKRKGIGQLANSVAINQSMKTITRCQFRPLALRLSMNFCYPRSWAFWVGIERHRAVCVGRTWVSVTLIRSTKRASAMYRTLNPNSLAHENQRTFRRTTNRPGQQS